MHRADARIDLPPTVDRTATESSRDRGATVGEFSDHSVSEAKGMLAFKCHVQLFMYVFMYLCTVNAESWHLSCVRWHESPERYDIASLVS